MENESTINSSWSSLNDELNNDSGPKNVVNIQLRRDPATGLGFNIVGGSDQQHMPGRSDIFVSRIRSGTPAFASGEINPGDIIISINGKALTDVTHQQAIDILKSDHGTVCELMVEQRSEKRIFRKYILYMGQITFQAGKLELLTPYFARFGRNERPNRLR
ncbi:PDZ domain (Also known as DHR or GLGF) domain-containing protein [Ditylenchus destructor]|nr:PDZ domain (Also known as DHR or GLGF) domain-containing protein [Ditylenchus destructor]